ncbi:myb-related transcription factor, partner of profilin-like [Eriocheir sinensis]|uniref:myb-related transcription factor, partner of profilin-like n=1 Tax=Eriocheir sinensis TaxID=95602 RepID=UPI0021C8A9FA|nr:myb-related transcription factor, partner of profilin-like [Eriocheir sinensis]
MASAVKRRRPNFSNEEILALITGVRQRWETITGPLSSCVTAAAKQRAWEAVVEEVNAVSGVGRSVEEVRMKFSDFKRHTKKKLGELRRGGSVQTHTLTDAEEAMAQVLDPAVVAGVGSGLESDPRPTPSVSAEATSAALAVTPQPHTVDSVLRKSDPTQRLL